MLLGAFVQMSSPFIFVSLVAYLLALTAQNQGYTSLPSKTPKYPSQCLAATCIYIPIPSLLLTVEAYKSSLWQSGPLSNYSSIPQICSPVVQTPSLSRTWTT